MYTVYPFTGLSPPPFNVYSISPYRFIPLPHLMYTVYPFTGLSPPPFNV